MKWLEVIAAARQDLHDKLLDRSQHDTLPTKIQKLCTRSVGSGFSDLDGTDRWYLWRFYGEADHIDEYDYDNPFLNFLRSMFTQEWHWLRPLGTFDFDSGRQAGTRYANDAGDIVTDDPDAVPWFPLDYQKAKRFIPDLVVDGTTYNIVHDMRPHFVSAGQFSTSKGQYHLQRRVQQVSTNAKLSAAAFGLEPFLPPAVSRRRQRRRDSA